MEVKITDVVRPSLPLRLSVDGPPIFRRSFKSKVSEKRIVGWFTDSGYRRIIEKFNMGLIDDGRG